MSYTKNTWLTGDVITAAKLNQMEEGIYQANQGSGGSGQTLTAGNGISISSDGVISLNLTAWTGGSY